MSHLLEWSIEKGEIPFVHPTLDIPIDSANLLIEAKINMKINMYDNIS